jgi:dipeptidyl aminopeptidase/acylaminoacyl peptidase
LTPEQLLDFPQGVGRTLDWSIRSGIAYEFRGDIYRYGPERVGASIITRGFGPCWSPDGSRLAYYAPDAEGSAQVWTVTAGSSPTQVTHTWYGVSPTRLAWTPDGSGLTLVEGLDPWLQLTATHEGNYERAPGVDEKVTAVRVGAPATFGLQRLVNIVDGQRQVLVGAGFGESLSSPQWSPDGRRLAFESLSYPFFGARGEGRIRIWEDGQVRDAFPMGISAGHGGSALQQRAPSWSPDGARLAYASGEGLMVGAPGRHAHLLLRAALPWGQTPIWSVDGRSLVVLVQEGVRVFPVQVDADSGDIRALIEGDVSCQGLAASPEGGGLALVVARPDSLGELMILGADGGCTTVTSASDALSELPLAKTRLVKWRARDGLMIEGLLTMPTGDPPPSGWPLYVHLHGGPELGLRAEPSGEPHYWASKGIVALWADYRGSGTYGNFGDIHEYTVESNDANMHDVLAAIDALGAEGNVDPSRVVLSGFSAGGHLAAWSIGRAPARFRAAIISAGPLDLVLMRKLRMSKPPTGDEAAALAAASPLTHADRIVTPTLLLYGERDDWSLIAHGYLLFGALRARGIPCEMWKYLDEGHVLTGREHQLHALQQKAAWVHRWLE